MAGSTNPPGSAGSSLTVIEVFADVGCPFTHVGLRRFVARREQAGRADVRLRVRAWPLEIVNGAPLDPDLIAEEVDDLRATVAPELFAGFERDHFPATSLPAMALAAAAYEHDLDLGLVVSLEVRSLLFEQGVDISRSEVLAQVAQPYGLAFDPEDRSSVLADHAAGLARGVVGSPHFFTPDGSFFCPALDISRDEEGHLRIAADPARFEAFISTCLA